MAPSPFLVQNITYTEQNNNQIPLPEKEPVEKDTDYYFIIYIPTLLFSLIYIITTLILFTLCKKSKLMIIRDINIYIYHTIAVIFLITLLLVEAALSNEQNKYKIPSFVYIIICAYSIPMWIITNVIRVKKIEFRLKIQNARLNNSIHYDDSMKKNDNLHINVIQFQLYEKWSNIVMLGLIGIITSCLLLIYAVDRNMIMKNKFVIQKYHTIIFATIFISMFYALYKNHKIRSYQETIGVQYEIKAVILTSFICSLGFIVFKLLSIKFKFIPVSIWFVIFFIAYHSFIVVKPVFTVHVYQNKVDMLHEKFRRHSVEKIEVSVDDEVNEMEISNFEKVLDPKREIYKEFKKFLVGEVCIENLLFYEAMINLLLKCQNTNINTNTNKSDSWNLKELAENPRGDPFSNKYSSQKETSITVYDEETPFYERLYKTATIIESPEIKNRLIKIFEKFIPEGSEYQLNLTSELVKSIESKIHQSENIDILLFKPALKEVYELLRWTNYPRFLQTRAGN